MNGRVPWVRPAVKRADPEPELEPIYAQLVYERSLAGQLASLSRAYRQFGRQVAEAMRPLARAVASLAEALVSPPPSPLEVLERIRRDQAVLDRECVRCGRGPHPDTFHRYVTWDELP